MPYRKVPFVNGSYYHIFNRGVEKREMFVTNKDYKRFIDSMFFYKYSGIKPKFSRFDPKKDKLKNKNIVGIVAYCLMPNHFHLLLRQLEDGGISKFVGQLCNSYTKYFNTKNDRVGPLLQGNFKSVLIESTEQLLHVSRYIHLNPYVAGMLEKQSVYLYSSLPEYFELKKGILEKEIVLEQFESIDSYEQFTFDQLDYGRNLELIKHHILGEE